MRECQRCNQSMAIPSDLEPPEHGLCWICSSEVVTELRARIEVLEDWMKAIAFASAEGWQPFDVEKIHGIAMNANEGLLSEP